MGMSTLDIIIKMEKSCAHIAEAWIILCAICSVAVMVLTFSGVIVYSAPLIYAGACMYIALLIICVAGLCLALTKAHLEKKAWKGAEAEK